jgi:hypothetical protein
VSLPLSDPNRLSELWEQEAVSIFESSHRRLLKDNADLFLEDHKEAEYRQTLFYNLFRCDAHRIAIETSLKILHEGRWKCVNSSTEKKAGIELVKKKISTLALNSRNELIP